MALSELKKMIKDATYIGLGIFGTPPSIRNGLEYVQAVLIENRPYFDLSTPEGQIDAIFKVGLAAASFATITVSAQKVLHYFRDRGD